MATHDNLQLMQTLDDAWNKQDWDTFSKRHAEHTVVFWTVSETYMTTKQSVLRSLRRSQTTI